MLWIKSFHIFFMTCWFAGIFYLPRLFVYHAMSEDAVSIDRFKVMERKLLFGIMTPCAVLTIIMGAWLIGFNASYYLHAGWFHAKMGLVALLVLYHIYCGKLFLDFKRDCNTHSHVFYRWLNEIPVIFLLAIIILVTVKPF